MSKKKVRIVSRWDSSNVLYVAKGAADVRAAVEEARAKGADLRGADLRAADLRDADLRGAYLGGADLRDAYLRDADLRGAYLGGAELRAADLRDANGIHPARVTDLAILADQVGKIRAYKLVTSEGYGPFNGGVKYEVGETLKARDADTNADAQCGAGINLATLPWCLTNWRQGYRVLLCEFTAKDIAAIPTATDGKFRVSKCKVIREVDLEPIFAAERETEEPTQ